MHFRHLLFTKNITIPPMLLDKSDESDATIDKLIDEITPLIKMSGIQQIGKVLFKWRKQNVIDDAIHDFIGIAVQTAAAVGNFEFANSLIEHYVKPELKLYSYRDLVKGAIQGEYIEKAYEYLHTSIDKDTYALDYAISAAIHHDNATLMIDFINLIKSPLKQIEIIFTKIGGASENGKFNLVDKLIAKGNMLIDQYQKPPTHLEDDKKLAECLKDRPDIFNNYLPVSTYNDQLVINAILHLPKFISGNLKATLVKDKVIYPSGLIHIDFDMETILAIIKKDHLTISEFVVLHSQILNEFFETMLTNNMTPDLIHIMVDYLNINLNINKNLMFNLEKDVLSKDLQRYFGSQVRFFHDRCINSHSHVELKSLLQIEKISSNNKNYSEMLTKHIRRL